jgi:hypothetical protein
VSGLLNSYLQPNSLQPESLVPGLNPFSLAIYYSQSRIEDVNEDSRPGCGVRFSHDVFDVFFHGLLGNQKGVCDFFVSPPLCQVLNDGLFTIR